MFFSIFSRFRLKFVLKLKNYIYLQLFFLPSSFNGNKTTEVAALGVGGRDGAGGTRGIDSRASFGMRFGGGGGAGFGFVDSKKQSKEADGGVHANAGIVFTNSYFN